jgi:hypothetical protein
MACDAAQRLPAKPLLPFSFGSTTLRPHRRQFRPGCGFPVTVFRNQPG